MALALSAPLPSGASTRRLRARPLMSDEIHRPVLVAETLRRLAPRAGGRYLDGTFGRGGHARAILAAAPGSEVIGLDRDPEAEAAAAALTAVHPGFRFLAGDFADLPGVLDRAGWDRVDGLLLDLGVASPQLDDAARGFSLRRNGPLDMRMDPRRGEPASELLDHLDEREIASLLHRSGERRSRAIARRIAARRPLRTTRELRGAVIAVTGPRRGRIDPATRTFLAVRRAVNREDEALAAVLAAGPDRLRPGGAMVVIAYHSGEDGPVKRRFRELGRTADFVVETRRPVRPDERERKANPRSRSARLRVLRRAGGEGS